MSKRRGETRTGAAELSQWEDWEKKKSEMAEGKRKGKVVEEAEETKAEETKAEKGKAVEDQGTEPAPSGDVGTAEEGDVAASGQQPRRRIRGLPRRKKRNAAAEAATAATDAAPAPAANQDIPGSGMDQNVAAGQRLQEETDGILKDLHLTELQKKLEEDNNNLRTEINDAWAQIKKKDSIIEQHAEKIRKQKNALRQEEQNIWESEKELYKTRAIVEQLEKESKDDKKRLNIAQDVINSLKKDINSATSELKDANAIKDQLITSKDDAVTLKKDLHERIAVLESELADHEAVATENDRLQEQMIEVHTSLEDAFSDMAKGLTIDEKFAYVRQHQHADQARRARIPSGASLHDELDNMSDAGSEHNIAPPKEILTFSGITSVDTIPVAVAKTAQETTPLSFSGITAVETAPVAAIKPAQKSAPFALSGITSVETAPVAAAVATSIAAKPAATAKKAAPFSFSGIKTEESAPVAKKVTPFTFTSNIEMETALEDVKPEGSLLSTATRRRLLRASLPASPPEPAAREPARAPEPAPVRVQRRTRNVYVTQNVDRTITPWWMWVLLLLAVSLFLGGFAGLWREKRIWAEANYTAYVRLTGGQQETWLDWVSLGAGDLLAGMVSGGLTRSLYG